MDVTSEVVIPRPRTQVAEFALNPANDPRWIKAISGVRWVTEPPLRTGSRIARFASFLGKRFEYVLEVQRLEPGSELVMRSSQGPFPMTVTYSFADVPGGTRVAIRNQGEPAGFFKLASSLLASLVQRNVEKDLELLREVITRDELPPPLGDPHPV